ncbi:MAG: quinolinate synthase NadA [Planctomycetaceae bacterium]|jgi:quinolinate synthase|nr:quinolinate synthase NadA [Planctomycetaceae bacterium]
MTLFQTLDEYRAITDAELDSRIANARKTLGEKVLILGHHYQRSEILRHADLTGDSFALSRAAARIRTCDHILFCGVHFMAETAYLLANAPENLAARNGKPTTVSLSAASAGCSMADLATEQQVETAWNAIGQTFDTTKMIPITYVNSTAAIKAFCGRRGGLSCTSSNAESVLKWAFARGDRVLFLPDQMLGLNTSLKMGLTLEETAVWSRKDEQLHAYSDDPQKSRIILWDGCCVIHLRFTTDAIAETRAKYPSVKIIVHPECHPSVVDQADCAGSTSQIIETIAASEPGTVWGVGTEWRLVERLGKTFPDKTVINLGKNPSVCRTMALTRLADICYVLEHLVADDPINLVAVDDAIAADARVCLERMLAAK